MHTYHRECYNTEMGRSTNFYVCTDTEVHFQAYKYYDIIDGRAGAKIQLLSQQPFVMID